MHPTAYAHMKLCIELYLDKGTHYRVLELGSQRTDLKHAIYRDLFDEYDVEYIGVDIYAGDNVDLVMRKPYRVPVRSKSVDVVVTGQVFEHIPFPWASFMELCRILKPEGLIFLTAPSRGHKHGAQDLWRYFPDSMRAFAAWGRVTLREVFTDAPPMNGSRIVYGDIDAVHSYWGDTLGVFLKPRKWSHLVRITSIPVIWWANRVGGIDHIPVPKQRPQRAPIHAGQPVRMK